MGGPREGYSHRPAMISWFECCCVCSVGLFLAGGGLGWVGFGGLIFFGWVGCVRFAVLLLHTATHKVGGYGRPFFSSRFFPWPRIEKMDGSWCARRGTYHSCAFDLRCLLHVFFAPLCFFSRLAADCSYRWYHRGRCDGTVWSREIISAFVCAEYAYVYCKHFCTFLYTD